MSDSQDMREFVKVLFNPEEPAEAEPESKTKAEPTSAPIIDSQANTPDPLTREEADRVLAGTTEGWLGALFHNNPQTYL